MKTLLTNLIIAFLFQISTVSSQDYRPMSSVSESVEIIVDDWGIPHIYAKNQRDLFFAQGYHAASDRLFQFEIWRRQATGTVSEILGEKELKRDIGTRLFKFRKDIVEEMNYYHQDGAEIIRAYVDGVNAYIKEIRSTPELLPIEFQLLNILPEYWTPEIVISRHQGLLGNIGDEIDIARAVVLLGEEKVKELSWFHPKDPDLSIDTAIDAQLLLDDRILELYQAYRRPVRFEKDGAVGAVEFNEFAKDNLDIGSNNWTISGSLTESGFPLLANDPHRSVAVPSLRYMAHLVAPGWNVIGGGEPEIPGISIGHNQYGAWGLTVFATDGEDLYVYKINPNNHNQYWHKGSWRDFEIMQESIPVKGIDNVPVELKYSIHGPVTYIDTVHHVAYAMKCAWLEIGGAPYMASLRMDQAKTYEEFRDACEYSHIPGENMIWADREGNIGWQSVGLAPVRKNHSGLVPVPGDGRYEWSGYLPMKDKPNLSNPEDGMIITANENVIPKDYDRWDAVGYEWSDPYRGNRIREVLSNGKEHTMMDMAQLQTDVQSLPARQLVPMLKNMDSQDEEIQWALQSLLEWDYNLSVESVAAAIYHSWENIMRTKLWKLTVPVQAQKYISSIQHKVIIDWLTFPDGKFGDHPNQGRDAFLIESLSEAIEEVKGKLGADQSQWYYGQADMKHVMLTHALSSIVSDSIAQMLNVGPLPRGGDAYSVGSTGYPLRQRSGATFRVIMDTGDWDRTLATNSPGQSGNPSDKHYDDLFKEWSQNKYFPLFYSRSKIEGVKDRSYVLSPQ
jgi:penicillin G amidase